MEKIYIKIDKKLDVGTNEIEFTLQEEGEYIYSCCLLYTSPSPRDRG